MGAFYYPPVKFLNRGFMVAFLGGLFLTTLTSHAHSESRQCRLLRSELKTLTRSNNGSNKENHYKALYTRQLKAIKFAKRDAISLRCISRSGAKRHDGSTACPALLSKINKMQRNLSQIEKKQNRTSALDQKANRRANHRQRIIQVQLKKLNCGAKTKIITARKTETLKLRKRKHRSFISRVLGLDTRRGRYSNRNAVIEPERPITRNVFRTLCVRLNDGFYFPISFATVRSAFDADNAICQLNNKNSEVHLFVYRNPSETIEDMRDLSGQLYIDLPNAFRYRDELVKENFAAPKTKSFTIIAGNNYEPSRKNLTSDNRLIKTEEEIKPPHPITKPDFYSDPDTVMAKLGKFELKPVKQQDLAKIIAQQKPVDYNPDKQSAIRVVGPVFLSDQQSAKLLLAPDQIQLQ